MGAVFGMSTSKVMPTGYKWYPIITCKPVIAYELIIKCEGKYNQLLQNGIRLAMNPEIWHISWPENNGKYMSSMGQVYAQCMKIPLYAHEHWMIYTQH